ncbi:type I toxin-antitoxin system SymE family toxin [Salmonella enterica]|nr:type I toxin-antitoxin system SymE family toxin [Salmonella enterica]EJH7440011.1 type I toxin-antitoxin system SymE family toxin [Salmonella enterica]EJH7879086.1 type I toxin-antitoxin system SymE family toxin [Salmonella enterica]EJI6712095.1 type I toxin-antitoxin system SymE family toxin [Salmonella enterica]
MAKRDSKPQRRTTTTAASEPQTHYYKVGYRPNQGRPDPLPQLTIKGRWLEALGFFSGQMVIVTAEKGRLIIEPEFKF